MIIHTNTHTHAHTKRKRGCRGLVCQIVQGTHHDKQCASKDLEITIQTCILAFDGI